MPNRVVKQFHKLIKNQATLTLALFFLLTEDEMLASFLLSLREGLEAALIIGIVLAALRKTNRSGLMPVVWQGSAAAIATSLVAGLLLTWLGAEFDGRAEQIFEGSTMLAAAILLTWMIFWMRRQAVNQQKNLEAGISQAAQQGNHWALFWLSFFAVGREGLELVLFLAATKLANGALQTTLGALLGLSTAILLGWGLFASSKRLRLGQFFLVINILLVFFAAGLLAHGIHEFNEAGIIPSIIEHIWDLNPILNEKQPVGQMLTALFGYNANPSLTESLAYLAYFLGLGILWKLMDRKTVNPQTT
jgi:high-affinity iron transporter